MTQVKESPVQSVQAGRKPPWWLTSRSLGQAFGQLLVAGIVTASWLLRDRPYSALVIVMACLGGLLALFAVVAIVTFLRHPDWTNVTFAPGPLSPGQLRLYSWIVGIMIVAGIVCVVLAFVLTNWSLCAVALLFFLGAVIAGSGIGRRAVVERPAG